METLFYSPNGSSWSMKDEEIHLDKSHIVTMTVRRYTHNNMQYSILVCADMDAPRNVFYTYEVRNPLGLDFESVPEKDFRIIKKFLQYAPISQDLYSQAEQRLQRKIDKIINKKYIQASNQRDLDRKQRIDDRAVESTNNGSTGTKRLYQQTDIDLQSPQDNILNTLKQTAASEQDTFLPIPKAACANDTLHVMRRNNLTMCFNQHWRPDVRMNEFSIKSYIQYCIQRSTFHQGNIISQIAIIHNAVLMMDVSNIITARIYNSMTLCTRRVSHGRQLRTTSDVQWMQQIKRSLQTEDSVPRSQFDIADRGNAEQSKQVREAMGTSEVDQENVKLEDDVTYNDDKSDSLDGSDIDAGDDDDFFGGVMGVYCRSSIHGDYSGLASLDGEKKIG